MDTNESNNVFTYKGSGGGDNIECLINLVFEFLREYERVLAYLVTTMLGIYV